MQTQQEQITLNHLKGWFNVPEMNFNRRDLNSYLVERETTKYGFVGYQVPYLFNGKFIHWTDFVIYIPNKIDVRIEVKRLDSKSDGNGLSLNPVADVTRMTNIPEKNLIFLLEGIGYGNEIVEMFNNIKKDNTHIIKSFQELAFLLFNILI